MVLWKKILIVSGIVIVFVILMNSVIMPWYVRHDTLVKVPSVAGMNFQEALNTLDEAGLEGLQGEIRFDPSKPIGTVIDQNPAPGQIVKDGRRIYLLVSGGEQLYDVPNLVGRTVREAKFMLAQRNIGVVEAESKPSAQYPPGIIISQIEQPGVKVKKGTKISVVVSAGIETGDLKVPDLIGKNVEEAKKLILLNKLTIGKINFQPSLSVPLNAVIDQYPKAYSMAKENQRVDLFVNREVKKKVPAEDEESTMEEVPSDDAGKDEAKEKDTDSDRKDELKKDKKDKKESIRKEDIKKETDPVKKDIKKKTDNPPPKEKDKKDEEGTKF